MNQATNVNIVPSYGQRGDLHFSQYDVGRTATINLYAVNEAYTIPVGATVKIQATKPSGLGFDVACTFSGSVVTVVSTETMTEESGRFPCELQITKDSDVIGTANFMFVVEPSPHPDGTVDGDAEEVINEIKALVLQSEGYALGTQDGVPVDNTSPYYHNNSKWWSEHPVGGGFTEEFKQALLDCFENVAWIGDDGQDYYDDLYNVLYPPAEVTSISAVYTQGGTVYDTASLDSLKADLVVTATYDDSSTAEVPSADYTLSGSLTVGTSTITVSYGGKTDTFTVTVTMEALYRVENQTVNRTDNGAVDSGVAILASDQSFAITFDGIQGSMPSSGAYRVVVCNNSGSNYKGIYVGGGNNDANALAQWGNSSNATGLWARNLSNTRIRFVYQHTQGDGYAKIYVKVANGTVAEKTMSSSFVSSTATVVIGSSGTSTGSLSYCWVGTITKSEIYGRTLTSDEIDAFLA